VPSFDDWEKQWKENPQKTGKPAVVQMDSRGQQASAADKGPGAAVAAAAERGEEWVMLAAEILTVRCAVQGAGLNSIRTTRPGAEV